MKRPQFSVELILSVSKTTLANGRENVTALSRFGITEELLNQFESDINTAEALPSGKSVLLEMKDFTQSKDDALDECFNWGRELRTRMQLVFERGSHQYQSFPSSDFIKATYSESVMMTVMPILIKIATKYQDQLSVYGQTPEVLTDGTDFLNALREADAAQEFKKDDKKSSTQDRNIKFFNLDRKSVV